MSCNIEIPVEERRNSWNINVYIEGFFLFISISYPKLLVYAFMYLLDKYTLVDLESCRR